MVHNTIICFESEPTHINSPAVFLVFLEEGDDDKGSIDGDIYTDQFGVFFGIDRFVDGICCFVLEFSHLLQSHVAVLVTDREFSELGDSLDEYGAVINHTRLNHTCSF